MAKKTPKPDKSVTIFDKKDLKAGAKTKDSKDLRKSDLTESQLASAAGSEVVAIVDGDEVTILAPTGDLAAALIAVEKEKKK